MIATTSPAATSARARFARRMYLLAAAGIASAAGALLYLSATVALTGTLIFTVISGVFVSVVLGGGLMAAGFFSAESGVDDAQLLELAAAPDARTEQRAPSL